MGKPVRIVDLARQMIELSGLKPDEDIKIEFVGTRPGEKLFEEITHKGENFVPTEHVKIFRFISQPMELDRIRKQLQNIHQNLPTAEVDELKLLLHEAVPDYSPYLARKEELRPAMTEVTGYRLRQKAALT